MKKKNLAMPTLAIMLLLPMLEARAVTLDEIQSQLQVLTLQVQALTQLQSQPGTYMPELQAPSISKNLYFGMTNDNDVRLLQQYLVKAGYFFGPVTGNFSTSTLKAVKQFQISHGIVPTGYVGVLTRASLKNAMASAQPLSSPATQIAAQSAVELPDPVAMPLNSLSLALNTENHPSFTYGGGSSDVPLTPIEPETPASPTDPEDNPGDSSGSDNSGGSNNPGDNSGSVSTSTPDQSGTGSTGTSTPDQSGSGSTGTSTPDQSGSTGTSTPDQSGSGSTGTSTPPADPPPISDNAHEPASFTLVTNRAFNSISASSSDISGSEGWDPYEESLWKGISIVQDPTAPVSPPNVLAAFYPAGTVGGTTGATPARMLERFSPAQSVYVSLWIKLSPNFQGNGTATNKAFYIWFDNQPVFFLSSEGVGSGTLVPTGRLQSDYDSQDLLPPNLVQNVAITRGQWQHWEVVVKTNTPGVANGEFSLWVDGTKVSEYNNITYLGPDQTRPITMVDLEPIWGGAGDVVAADQYQYFDNVYVSTSGN